MKNPRFLVPLLMVVIALQSILIFSSFSAKEKDEDVLQSYKIERKYYDGKYFYVLLSGGEAKGFLRE